MDCILFHVKFEGGLSISVLRKSATSAQKIGAQNRRVFFFFLKSLQISKAALTTCSLCLLPTKKPFAHIYP
jgi:hypothetical protein